MYRWVGILLGAADQVVFSWISGGSCKTLESKKKASFRTSEALHRMVFTAKRDPGSRIFKRFWIPAFAGMTE
jgi:hypothetical protein